MLAELGLTYESVYLDFGKGEQKGPEHTKYNPNGRIPTLIDHTNGDFAVWESNAILLHYAEATSWLPSPGLTRTRVHEWLFFEQYSHEPYIAVRRYQLHYLKRAPGDLDPKLAERGADALRLMEATLARSVFLVGETLTLADVALVAYTRMAHEGGFDLEPYPAVRAWIGRVETGLGIGPYAGPA